jgi:hypothetical protein
LNSTIVNDLTDNGLKMYKKKVTRLKVKVLRFMKTWIKQKWQRMVKKDPNLPSNIKDLQKQWGDMNVNDKAKVDRTCRSFWKLIQPVGHQTTSRPIVSLKHKTSS